MKSARPNTNNYPSGLSIRHNFKPGDIGYLTYLHGVLHARECGWDHTFETYVAIAFCRTQGYRSVFLWTESSLTVAARLYLSVGFQLTEERTHKRWGATVTEQRYSMRL